MCLLTFLRVPVLPALPPLYTSPPPPHPHKQTHTGELAEYVVSELNVVSLETCNDVLAYAEPVAEPEWQLLGKKLGKDMGKVCVWGGG